MCVRRGAACYSFWSHWHSQGDVQSMQHVVCGIAGTGKTLVARALAATASKAGTKVSFFMRKGADVLSKWVGEAERQLRLLFEEAQKAQPSIIFFDEIDGLAPVSPTVGPVHDAAPPCTCWRGWCLPSWSSRALTSAKSTCYARKLAAHVLPRVAQLEGLAPVQSPVLLVVSSGLKRMRMGIRHVCGTISPTVSTGVSSSKLYIPAQRYTAPAAAFAPLPCVSKHIIAIPTQQQQALTHYLCKAHASVQP